MKFYIVSAFEMIAIIAEKYVCGDSEVSSVLIFNTGSAGCPENGVLSVS